MAPSTRPDGNLNLNLSGILPVNDLGTHNASTSPFSGPKLPNGSLSTIGSARHGAGSPLHEQGSRLFPRRTRELQGQSTLSPSIWGPPTSGTSTPLVPVPESPSQDGFPDLVPLSDAGINSPARRARAGTLPSRISPVGTANGQNAPQLAAKTSRPTPSTSPFRLPTSSTPDSSTYNQPSSSSAALLSRLRAGSLPQRSSLLGSPGPFGPSVFGPSWPSRDRAATLTSIKSAEDPASPAQSTFSREGMTDNGVRTLDYLGLAETPQQSASTHFQPLSMNMLQQDQSKSMNDLLAKLEMRNANRFRSFSVNAPQKYADEREDGFGNAHSPYQDGNLTPSVAAALEAEYSAVQEKVRLHNQAVQAFAENASAARPRARTAGIVETPQRTSLRSLFKPPSPMDSVNAVNGQNGSLMNEMRLSDSFQMMNIGGDFAGRGDAYDDEETPVSRSLWIGSIPISTTTSSLDTIFSRYGALESTRVLTHKNCGFVNFENIDSAVRARHLLNGKEIFPGAGPVRIGFAKVPGTSASITPAHNTLPPSPTKESYEITHSPETKNGGGINDHTDSSEDLYQNVQFSSSGQSIRLLDLQPEVLQIVLDFGAQQVDLPIISSSLQSAISYSSLETDIPPVPETGHTRMYDAPRLRDIRKRIDSGVCGHQEIEQIANDMLPEMAELASDYLGNTVVQKLFEYCSEQTKELMLTYITPHLAEIGVHKNGTWAAQKIIGVCKTDSQTRMIVESLRPYTVPLFLDQYGNYVLQCCLHFGSPYNDFIFETMLTQMLEIAKGRFGARAMRACLEAHQATRHQQRMLAAVIALNSVQLATNTNGALILTWFLDTCTFPHRRTVLAPRLIPHLVHLCTHKVAYLTVLKVVNQRNEPEARDMILNALFFSQRDSTLEQILGDQASGATLIFKILTTPFYDDEMRGDIARKVANVLTRIKAQPSQGYKRLMDEVGLSSRPPYSSLPGTQLHAHPSTGSQGRPASQPSNGTFVQPQMHQRQYNGSFMTNPSFAAYESMSSPARTGSADSFGYPSYGHNQFHGQGSFSPLQQVPQQQLQYQNFVPASQRTNGTYLAHVGQNDFAGYATPPSTLESLRGMQSHASPLYSAAQMSPMMGQGGLGQTSYTQAMPPNLYSYQQQTFYPQQMQSVYGMGRNRRR